MKKNITIFLIFSVIFISLPTVTVFAQYKTGTCAELVCNPAPNLFSTSFCQSTPCTFDQIIISIIKLALGLAGLIALGYIILGGYQYATARGNDESAKTGRKTLTNAIIGLVIILLSYLIVTIVINAAFGNVNGNLPSRQTVPNSTNTLPGITP